MSFRDLLVPVFSTSGCRCALSHLALIRMSRSELKPSLRCCEQHHLSFHFPDHETWGKSGRLDNAESVKSTSHKDLGGGRGQGLTQPRLAS